MRTDALDRHGLSGQRFGTGKQIVHFHRFAFGRLSVLLFGRSVSTSGQQRTEKGQYGQPDKVIFLHNRNDFVISATKITYLSGNGNPDK